MTPDADQPPDDEEREDRPPAPPLRPPSARPPAQAPRWVPQEDEDADRAQGDLAGNPDTDY